MKKILLIALLGFALASCEQADASHRRYDESTIVKDQHGVNYRIVVIEGCEFYFSTGDGSSGLTKVDCNCVPNKNNR